MLVVEVVLLPKNYIMVCVQECEASSLAHMTAQPRNSSCSTPGMGAQQTNRSTQHLGLLQSLRFMQTARLIMRFGEPEEHAFAFCSTLLFF